MPLSLGNNISFKVESNAFWMLRKQHKNFEEWCLACSMRAQRVRTWFGLWALVGSLPIHWLKDVSSLGFLIIVDEGRWHGAYRMCGLPWSSGNCSNEHWTMICELGEWYSGSWDHVSRNLEQATWLNKLVVWSTGECKPCLKNLTHNHSFFAALSVFNSRIACLILNVTWFGGMRLEWRAARVPCRGRL